ncbi:hypothetical protein BGZ70_005738, partial [Mortierella alpina]
GKDPEQDALSRSTDQQESIVQGKDPELDAVSDQSHQHMDAVLHETVRDLLESIPEETVHQHMDTLVDGTVQELLSIMQQETTPQQMDILSDEAISQLLQSAQEEAVATTAVVTTQPNQPKRPQTLWQKLECHCAMATEELGSLAGLLSRNLGPRVKERSRQLLDEVRWGLLELSASCRKFAQAAHGQDIQSIQTAAAAARDEVNLAKAAYTRAIQELEGYGKVEPSTKTELEQSCVRYHELLFQATQQQAMSSTPSHDLENAYQDMNLVMQKIADGQTQAVIEATA